MISQVARVGEWPLPHPAFLGRPSKEAGASSTFVFSWRRPRLRLLPSLGPRFVAAGRRRFARRSAA